MEFGATRSMASEKRRAVVLLSGGLDSATTLAMCQRAGFEAYAISFRYGQRHAVELSAAAAVARHMQVARHIVVDIDLRAFGGSALTADLPVPKHDDVSQIGSDIPLTYVPARNTIFLSLALGWAETLDTGELFVGVNAVDYSGYPDCRPEYVAAFEAMANLATRAAVLNERRVKIHTPLIHLTKAQIIREGVALGVDYGLTTSCYDPTPEGLACGHCDSCLLRRRGFEEAGVPDPTRYV